MWTMTAKQMEITEQLGWKIYEGSNYYELSQYSPAGEDFSIDVICDGLSYADELKAVCDCFEPDEHAVMWYGQNRGEPSSLRDLLNDAEAEQEMIRELANAIGNLSGYASLSKKSKGKCASKCTKPMVKTIPKKAPAKKSASKCLKPKSTSKKPKANKNVLAKKASAMNPTTRGR